MVRVLNVAEKNDAAKSIAEIMSRGGFRRRNGQSVYNKIYEFDYYLFNQRCQMIMTSVSGHLLNIEFTGSYKNWQQCNPVVLFEAPITTICLPDYEKIKKTLESEVRNCQYLIIWTDGDREGENIGFEIIEVCQKIQPNITVLRARFSEITTQAIQRACANLAPPDKRISDAVNVRRELDLRIGAAFTRFQTLRLKRVFPDILGNQLISYGSCQFPTLGFVVERYKQVQAFIPEAFWKLKVTHKKEDTLTEFTWKRGRLFDHTACLVLYQVCLEAPTARVVDIKSRNKSKWRPQPLDTVEFEKLASRKLRINAKQAMTIAEKLYTKGYISYPRTETTIFPKELNLVSLVEMQSQDPNWGAFAQRVLEWGPNPRQGTKTDNAHPPIHPTKYIDTLQANDKAVYDLVVRHFLACVSKDAEGRETTIEIDVNNERFAVNGLMIIARNYLEVYPYDRWNAKIVGEYALNETFQPTAIEMDEGETSAPNLLTEADLIGLMEKHGIGTDATHAEHIETIKSRLYVGLNESNRFIPGELGMGLVEGYDMMGLHMSKPHLRAELEADLKRITEGTRDPKVVLEEQVKKYKEYFIEVVRQAIKLDNALSTYFNCQPGEVAQEIMKFIKRLIRKERSPEEELDKVKFWVPEVEPKVDKLCNQNVSKFLKKDVVKTAKHITQVSWDIFKKIEDEDVIEWRKSETFKEMHQLYAKINIWTIDMILSGKTSKVRSKIIQHFLKISQKLLTFCNINAAHAIISALQTEAIQRLFDSWTKMSKKNQELFFEFDALFPDHEENFVLMNQLMEDMQANGRTFIPYMALLIRDEMTLKHMENGENPLSVKRSWLIWNNFRKVPMLQAADDLPNKFAKCYWEMSDKKIKLLQETSAAIKRGRVLEASYKIYREAWLDPDREY
ncbi:hypothetical protein JTE90_027999 [Oedothorax gibbosus]|uniref:DNA topoisomerase n=1 Tax=Oedothorax gibbosus TaxID=931172 RepID=A0AAV6VDP2_9ARAC|nr:hypothetical protein JTE90_027999 [Oedothorax gibbosus]